ncbi:MAG: ABC transporter substrate-binding protein [Spirochaetaceae bacterium]
MKRALTLLLVVLMTVSAFNAFAGGAQEGGGGQAGEPTQVLRYACTSDFADFHTAVREGGGPSQVVATLYNALIALPTNLDELRAGEYKPSLAESWEVSDDGRTWTFKLRQGVQFHKDYGELTAEDVAFTYGEVNADPAWGANHNAYSELDIEVVDDYTVAITTPVPNPQFPVLVANVGAGHVISKAAFEEKGMEAYRKDPIGTGPFQFVEHIPNEIVLVERFDDYFEGTPILERIEFIPMDVNSGELALRRGSVHFLNSGVESQDWVEKMEGFGIDAMAVFRESIMFLQLKTSVEPLDDIRVRRAIQHAINADEVVELYGRDIARRLRGPVPDTFDGATEDVPQYEYDPDRARELLAEAGYADGFSLEGIITERDSIRNAMIVVQEQLRDVGIDFELSVHPHSTWHELMRSGEGTINNRATGRLPFADIILTENFHADAIVTRDTGIRNMMDYDNSLVNRNIEEARSEMNEERRKELYKEALVQIMEDAVAVPLVVRASVVARHPAFDPGYDLDDYYQADGHIVIDHRARIVEN